MMSRKKRLKIDEPTLIEQFKNGRTYRELAELHGISTSKARCVVTDAGLTRIDGGAHVRSKSKVKKKTLRPRNTERELAMVALYKQGQTLQQVGDIYGVSRERVRQLILRYGVKGPDGGAHKKKKQRDYVEGINKFTRRQAHLIECYGEGMTDALHRSIIDEFGGYAKSPLLRFKEQKMNSKYRNIGWEITFVEWWELWEDKWESRGCFGSGLVMSRIDDMGPYSKDNVEIITLAENSAQARYAELKRKAPQGLDRQMQCGA